MIFFHQVRRRRDGVRVVLFGEVDLAVCEELRRVLTGVVAVSPGAIVLDLHHVTFLDCAAIGEFVRAYTDARGRSHTLTVSRPRDNVLRILKLTDVLAVLTADGADVVRAADRTTVPPPRDPPDSARPASSAAGYGHGKRGTLTLGRGARQ